MPLQMNKTKNTEADGCSETKGENQTNDIEDKPLSNDGKEKKLRNTFGWTRIEVLMMLGVCVFFASLCFSVVLESLQTLVHIGHMDAMHNPVIVLVMGVTGLLLNGFCYLLIGGYTFHQGSFLHVTSDGDVVLESVVTVTSVRQGQRRLSRPRRSGLPPPQAKQRQGLLEALRDIISCLFVILCSVIVYFIDIDYAKYVDPALAIVSAVVLLCLTYPYMKESGLILLQTIPNTMNIEILNKELINTFPNIVNIHDFHVWQLTSSKVFSTIHIIFVNPLDFARQCDDVTLFLMEQGITHVTIQPEFISNSSVCISKGYECLMTCKGKGCVSKHCCGTGDSGPTAVSAVTAPAPPAVITPADDSVTTPEPTTITTSDFARQCDDVTLFLMEQGITHVTIQPEFISNSSVCVSKGYECLMTCKGKGCVSKHCCGTGDSGPTPGPTAVSAVTAPAPPVVITPADDSVTTPEPTTITTSEPTENLPNARKAVSRDPEIAA